MGRPRLGRWPLLLLLLLLVYVVATATRAAAKGPLRPLRGSFLPRIRVSKQALCLPPPRA